MDGFLHDRAAEVGRNAVSAAHRHNGNIHHHGDNMAVQMTKQEIDRMERFALKHTDISNLCKDQVRLIAYTRELETELAAMKKGRGKK